MTSIPIIIFIVRKTLTSMSIDNKHFFTVRLTSWIVTCWPLPLSPMAQPASMRPLAMLEVLIIWFTEDMEIFLVWTTRGPSFMVSYLVHHHHTTLSILSMSILHIKAHWVRNEVEANHCWFSFSWLADNHFPRSIPEPTPLIHGETTSSAAASSSRPNNRPPSPPRLPACCGRLPASVVNKLNKLSLRSGLFKVVGEFGLRENLYYGSIFICMTLIVIVCFLVINNRGGAGLSSLMSSGNAAAYDGGKFSFSCFLKFEFDSWSRNS